MYIGGLQKFSLLDYPGQISAIVFTQGCNFRCPFCYNPMLVTQPADEVQDIEALNKANTEKSYSRLLPSGKRILEDDFFVFLKKRKNKLDAVVITGGEPTLRPNIIRFAKKIKDMDFKVKLDTNGTRPDIIKKLLANGLLDYIAMDIKTAPDKYKNLTGVDIDFNKIKKSVIIIKEGRVPYEFRTTIVPGMHEPEDIKKIGMIIKGAEKWYLQEFRAETDLIDNNLKKTKPFTNELLNKFKNIGALYAKYFELR